MVLSLVFLTHKSWQPVTRYHYQIRNGHRSPSFRQSCSIVSTSNSCFCDSILQRDDSFDIPVKIGKPPLDISTRIQLLKPLRRVSLKRRIERLLAEAYYVMTSQGTFQYTSQRTFQGTIQGRLRLPAISTLAFVQFG